MADRRTILVVDDDSLLIDALLIALELDGFSVATATDGEAALACVASLASEQLALIVIDVRMPQMDGVAFICEFRRQLSPRVPVIAMAALPDDLAAAQAAGADALLQKPFPIGDFLALVRRMSGEPAGV
ncbi:MAG: response regulator [Chloroflexi bacterium]|nr:response regulator [Chloroflexota bacterium]